MNLSVTGNEQLVRRIERTSGWSQTVRAWSGSVVELVSKHSTKSSISLLRVPLPTCASIQPANVTTVVHTKMNRNAIWRLLYRQNLRSFLAAVLPCSPSS